MKLKIFLVCFLILISFSNFKSFGQPDIPALDSVSVIFGSVKVIIGWHPSNDVNTVGYIIYESLPNGVGRPLDTVKGRLNTSYTDTKLNPTSKSQPYRIAAFDNTNKTSPMGDIHNTVFLNPPSSSPCDHTIQLNWNGYNNFNPPLSVYKIYVSENGNPYRLLDSTIASVTSYTHKNVKNDSLYSYYIRAVAGNNIKTSSSNIQQFRFHEPKEPQFAYIRSASVENNKNIRLKFHIDISAYISTITIYRATQQDTNFKFLSSIQPANNADPEFLDDSTNVNDNNYFYKIYVYDSCGRKTLTSNKVRTMRLLSVKADINLTNQMIWNNYEGFLAGTGEFYIYRQTDNGSFEQVGQVPASTNNFTDDISSMLSSQGYFTYYIEAIENGADNYGFFDTSRSNEITVKQNPFIWVPNAFTPGGLNPYFFPVCSLIDENNFHFTIYDRWGEKIFETTKPHDGWNGTYKGSDAPAGIYTYIITFQDVAGSTTLKKGLVTLVR